MEEEKQNIRFFDTCTRLFKSDRMKFNAICPRFIEPSGILNVANTGSVGSPDCICTDSLTFEVSSYKRRHGQEAKTKILVFADYIKETGRLEVSFYQDEKLAYKLAESEGNSLQEITDYIVFMLRKTNFFQWYKNWGYDDEYVIIPMMKILKLKTLKDLYSKKNRKYLKKLFKVAKKKWGFYLRSELPYSQEDIKEIGKLAINTISPQFKVKGTPILDISDLKDIGWFSLDYGNLHTSDKDEVAHVQVFIDPERKTGWIDYSGEVRNFNLDDTHDYEIEPDLNEDKADLYGGLKIYLSRDQVLAGLKSKVMED